MDVSGIWYLILLPQTPYPGLTFIYMREPRRWGLLHFMAV